jgi:hypothetical protein
LCAGTGGKVASGENRPRKKTKDGSAKGQNPNGHQPPHTLSGGGLAPAKETSQQPWNGRGTNQDSGNRKKKKGFAGEEAFLAPTSRVESRTGATGERPVIVPLS